MLMEKGGVNRMRNTVQLLTHTVHYLKCRGAPVYLTAYFLQGKPDPT